jgi:arylsulfatase A-like enzyme
VAPDGVWRQNAGFISPSQEVIGMTVRAWRSAQALAAGALLALLATLGPAGLSLAARGSAAAGAAPADTRPNIVLIMADDLDWLLGTLDYTPNIRTLLQYEGVTFDNALVPVSLCCPSRVSLLRGQYVHNHQIYTNGPPDGGFDRAVALGLEQQTVATVLQASGYTTALVGKYLNGYPATGQETYIPPGWDEFYSPSSDQAYFGYNYSMNMNGVLVPFGSDPEDYMTDVLSGIAVNYLTRTVPTGEPFFLYLSTYAPHGPSTPAPRHAGLFNDVNMPVGGSFNELDISDKPPFLSTLPLLTITQTVEMNQRYRERLRSMQAVDEMVATLVTTLQTSGVLTNTYIIFTSDNGYHLGQHRLPAGKYTNYEEDLRVPLIVRGPGVPISQTTSALVSTMDLAPTFAEIAGTSMPSFIDGRSLLGLLSGLVVWREVFFLEQYPFFSNVGDDPGLRNGLLEPGEPDTTWLKIQSPGVLCNSDIEPKPIYTGIHGTRYKYVEHHACDPELYDLLLDRYEMENLALQAPQALRIELANWLRVMETCAAETCRIFEMAPPEVLYLPLARR